jgi:2-dehydropantoate 2-reductase
MLQDHMKGRLSEIDMINGVVAEESKKRGRPTPVTDVLIELTNEIHAGKLKPSTDNFEIVKQRIAAR